MKMRVILATLLAVAIAAPAMAFNVEWHGDFNNRFMWSSQADVSGFGSLSAEGYNNNYYNGTYDSDNAAGLIAGNNVPVGGAMPLNFVNRQNDSDFLGEIKYRMWLTAQDDDKKVKGTVAFEFGGLEFGDTTQADFAGDKNVFELRMAYVDFAMPGDDASRVYVGLQPVGYNKFLWNDTGAGIKWVRKSGDLKYSLGWFRDDVTNQGQGGNNKLTNDDVYAFDITYAAKDMPKLNAFVLYLEEGKETDGFGTSFMDQKIWYGLSVSGQADNLFYGATFIKEEGAMTADDAGFFQPTGIENELDRDAWLANLEATLKVDKARVKLGWLYTTGDDDPTDGDVENYNNIDSYMGGFGSVVVFDSFADDNTMVSSPYILDKGLNMIYAGVDYDLSDKASVGASYLWINAAEDMNFGTDKLAPAVDAFYDFDKDLGHEISVRGSYKITKNLTAGLAVGYLIAGDGLDAMANYASEAGLQTGLGDDADDIIRADASVRLKF